MNYGFGVDLGGTTVKLALFTQDGQMLEKWEIPTIKQDGGKRVLPDIARSVTMCMQRRGLEKSQILGIGVGVPGPVEKGVVNRCENIGWGVTDVKKELSDLLGLPVAVGNDANVAALGEAWKGSAAGCENMIMVTLGTGVGGGLVLHGRLLNGAHAAAGEIGHILLNPNEKEPCGCGSYGCAEQYCSATGVVRLAKRYLQSHETDSVLRSGESLEAKAVFDAAAAGDAAAKEILEQVFDYLGRLLGTICNVIDPQVVVIGGGVSRAGEILLDGIGRYFSKYAFHPMRGQTEFRLAALGNDAGVYGAMKLLDEIC